MIDNQLIQPQSEKKALFTAIEEVLRQQGLNIDTCDKDRPWGGFFVINEDQAQAFSNLYFDGMDVSGLRISGKLSPKILVVAPNTRLSWQYHHRRAEIWRAVQGKVGVVTSLNDTEGELKMLKPGDFITLQQGERHRLIGLDNWGIVAEIWQHTDTHHPSDEGDIVRVQDDFGR